MKSMRTLLGLCLLFASFVGEVAAVTLRTVGKGATTGGTVTVPVTVSGFSSKLSMQFSLQWDQAVLRYSGISGLGLPEADLTDFNVTQVRVDAGQLSMAWVTRTGSAQSVADGTVVVNVAFDVIGATGTSSAIRFVDSPTATLVDDVPPTRDEGTVTVEAVVVANTPPTITAIADQTVTQGTATPAIGFTVSDAETPVDSLKFSKDSSNLELVPLSGIVVAGTGGNLAVTVTPVAGKTGFATISLTFTDGGGLPANRSFKLTVGAPNNPPTITSIGNQVIWDGGSTSLAFTLGDVETSADQLAVTVTSSNLGVIPVSSLAISGTGANQTLSITPIVGTEGATLVTLTVKDTDLGEARETFSVTVTKRRLYFVAASGPVGGDVEIPVRLSAQGNEFGLQFSLKYDPTVFSNPRLIAGADAAGVTLISNMASASQGLVGVLMAFQSGQGFPVGEREILKLTMTAASSASGVAYGVAFADTPFAKSLSTSETIALDADFQSGTVTLTSGIEGDVSPRPNGNGNVDLFDWIQTGRFAAKLDSVGSATEFQRADTAPKADSGDGKVDLFDWIQTGRYAAKLDPNQAAGGPLGSFGTAGLVRTPGRASEAIPAARLTGFIERDAQGPLLRVTLESDGNVSAVGFSVAMDSDRWSYGRVGLAGEASEAVLVQNNHDALKGRVGLLVAQHPGLAFQSGVQDLVVIRLESTGLTMNPFGIRFANLPVEMAVASRVAEELGGVFQIEGVAALPLEVFSIENDPGSGIRLGLRTLPGAHVSIEASSNLLEWREIWSGRAEADGSVRFQDESDANDSQRYYRLREFEPSEVGRASN
ncbi:MAG: hypothetical protein K9N62_08070 [Verrucomicrobia bacterium]|nr:hypothetical protein [Verrucomicrobiota bacterium]